MTAEKIPDKKKCLELMDKYNMLSNIKRHSIVVCKIAMSIAENLNANGENLNLPEIFAAALLHDITKTRSLETGENHAITGAKVLRELGYERIAEIVREHIAPENSGETITEEEIISYADKRVLHDRLVSLDERFDYLVKRYGKNEKAVNRINTMKEKIKETENRILKKTDLKFL